MNGTPDTEEHLSLPQVLEDVLARRARGEGLDRAAILAEHPELAEELGPCLTALDLMHGVDLDGGAVGGRTRGRIGDFDLVREIGRGGMGIVYEAEQISLRRRVALKTLPFASTLDPRHLQRFRNEALAAANLHHTHIVPVYSVGTDRGVHYYAMQYIDGTSAAELIAELRAGSGAGGDGDTDRGTSSASLRAVTQGSSVESRDYCRAIARLGVQAAEALHHAHEQGVVHRDVKPANLLVDIGGELWVTDFGLASIRDADGPTVTGDLVGTVRYMSPEQTTARRMPVDQRTDVYSLGVTLYELLTLEHAVTGSDTHQVMQNIVLEDPVPARRRNAAVPPELETIVGKAMAKRPEDRYLTARDMAEDLARHLEDRPIRARKPTPGARLAKWGRRHRPVVWAGAAVLAVALLALSVATVAIARERDDAVRARGHAAATLTRLSEISERVLTDVGETIATDADLAPRLRPLLATLLEGYRTALDGLRDEPGLAAEVARGHQVLARVQMVRGRYDEAEHELDRAAALLGRLGVADGAHPGLGRDLDVLARDRRALVLVRRQWVEMERALRSAIAREAAARDAEPLQEATTSLMPALAAAGHFYASTGHTAAALDAYARAAAILQRQTMQDGSAEDAWRLLAWVHEQLGLLRLEQADVPALIARTPAERLWEAFGASADLEQAIDHFWNANLVWLRFLEDDATSFQLLRHYWRTYWLIGRLYWKTTTGVPPGTVDPSVAWHVEREIGALEPIPADDVPLSAEPRPFSVRGILYGMGYDPPYNRWKVTGYATGGGSATGEVQAYLFTLPGGMSAINTIVRLTLEGGDTLEIITYGGEPIPVTGAEKGRFSFAVVGGTGRFAEAAGGGRGSVFEPELPEPNEQHPSQASLRLELEGEIHLR